MNSYVAIFLTSLVGFTTVLLPTHGTRLGHVRRITGAIVVGLMLFLILVYGK